MQVKFEKLRMKNSWQPKIIGSGDLQTMVVTNPFFFFLSDASFTCSQNHTNAYISLTVFICLFYVFQILWLFIQNQGYTLNYILSQTQMCSKKMEDIEPWPLVNMWWMSGMMVIKDPALQHPTHINDF